MQVFEASFASLKVAVAHIERNRRLFWSQYSYKLVTLDARDCKTYVNNFLLFLDALNQSIDSLSVLIKVVHRDV